MPSAYRAGFVERCFRLAFRLWTGLRPDQGARGRPEGARSIAGVDERRCQRLYREEAAVLGKIGQVFLGAEMPQIEVRLPRDVAEAAVAAWERNDDESVGPINETFEQRVVRSRAASLSLIGLAISERGRWTDDEVVVALDPVFIGNAVEAADDLPT